MAHRYFEGKVHAQLYAMYRPLPPISLIQRMISFLKEKASFFKKNLDGLFRFQILYLYGIHCSIMGI